MFDVRSCCSRKSHVEYILSVALMVTLRCVESKESWVICVHTSAECAALQLKLVGCKLNLRRKALPVHDFVELNLEVFITPLSILFFNTWYL